ncbi:MAG: hypothetical protein JW895_07195 [Thermoleophilaceae bacterium]|nr:hypothetical protein [Thermoleophilaceae bacterium]
MRRVLPLAAGLLALLPATAAADCDAARSLRTGPTDGGLYATIAPFEHFSTARTQVFPHTCGGAGPVRARVAPGDYRTPYIATTRERGQLYLYGYGPDPAAEGAYVASVNPRTLRERWRTRIRDTSPVPGWSYPGVMAVHGNGRLYAVYASVIVKLDPRTGRTLARRELPEDPDGTGAAYNGLIVMPDGRIATKRIERGPCPAAGIPPTYPSTVGAFVGLTCAGQNALPTPVVVLEPGRLRIVSVTRPPEPITGRITTAGRYVYAAGRDTLFRFRYRRGRLALDRGWGPVVYRRGGERPGTGPGVMGGFVVVQTNFLPSAAPLTLTAVSVRDSRRVFRIRPFEGAPASWVVSKAALDAANRTVVTHDTSAHRMAALRLDPRRGFRVRWSRPLTSLAFSALVGRPRGRQIVIPDLGPDGDRVLWLDERSGRVRARSRPLATQSAPGNIVTPGFGGRFYYPSWDGRLWELTPH